MSSGDVLCKRDYGKGQAKLEAKRRQGLQMHTEDQKGEDNRWLQEREAHRTKKGLEGDGTVCEHT